MAFGDIEDGIGLAVLERRVQAKRKKPVDDLSLCAFCCFSARSTAASVLHRKVKRCGAGFVFQRRITPSIEQAFHSGGASSTDCPRQGRSALFLLGINICSAVV